jgi:elongation factor Ts
MTAITAEQVKKLRDQTGAGMMDCKAALTDADGNFEAATTLLRTRGLATAAKKAGRTTAEGLIGQRLSSDRSTGVLVEVNCESDFVARTEDFQRLLEDVLNEIEAAGDAVTDDWLTNPDGPVRKRVAEAIGKLRENMAVSRFVRYSGKGYVGQYVHSDGKQAAQIELGGLTPALAARPELAALAKDLAMQIVALKPQYVSREAVPAAVVEKEKAIYRKQMEGSGKPPQVIEKIVEGKLGSFYEQVALLEQPFVRDDKSKTKVRALVDATARAVGAPLAITRFARLKVGEAAS